MAYEAKDKEYKFVDYINIIYKWRKFLIINFIIMVIISTAVAFLIPPTYKSTAVIMAAPEAQTGLGGLTGLLSNKSSAASISSRLFGSNSNSDDMLFGILNSRSTIVNVINKFDLLKYYEIDDSNMDKTIRLFKSDISFDPNDHGMIEISAVNKNPKVSADIANYFITILDSLNIKLNIEQAKNNKTFIEQRYAKNISDLKCAEDSMYLFQKKYGVFAVPQQIEAEVKASAELESQLMQQELLKDLAKNQYGVGTPTYEDLNSRVKFIKDKINELKSSDKVFSNSNVFLPFKEMPEISLKYLRLFRDIEIQSKIMEVILPMYEQAKIDEQKSIPTILVIDHAVASQLKYQPKRSFIILGISFVSLFLFVMFVFIGEKAINYNTSDNAFIESEKKIFKRIKNIYRLNK